jgi:GNAT superfamily N-acetyltransferase
MSYTCQPLDLFTAPMYGGLATPRYRKLIERRRADLPVVAIGARDDGEPVGLALAGFFPETQKAWLHWLFVAEPHRRRGIGAVLLRQLDDELGAQGCKQIEASYHTGLPAAPTLEGVLAKCDWAAPSTVQIIYQIGPSVLHAPWMQPAPLPARVSLFPLVELTPAEIAAIEARQAAGPWFDAGLSPFYYPVEKIDPYLSLGVRSETGVVGWIIARRIEAQTTTVNILFVSPEVRKQGIAVALIVEHTRRQVVDLGIQRTMFNCDVANTRMIELMDGMMTPYLLGRYEKRQAKKEVTFAAENPQSAIYNPQVI